MINKGAGSFQSLWSEKWRAGGTDAAFPPLFAVLGLPRQLDLQAGQGGAGGAENYRRSIQRPGAGVEVEHEL